MIQKRYQHAIWQLISMTREDFARTYLATLDNFEAFIQEEPQINLAIERAIRALKIRRAYMLPVGADTETCYRQSTIWTYAVFLSALTLECWKKAGKNSVDNYSLILPLPPSPVQTWLQRFPNVQKTLQFDPVTYEISENILAEIIRQAEKIHSQYTEQKRQDLMIEQNLSLSKAVFSWINENLRHQTLEMNDAFIYRVEEGVFLIAKELYEQFVKANPKLSKHYLKEHQNEITFVSMLMEDSAFIKNETAHLHTYFIDPWKDRNFKHGLLLTDLCQIPGSETNEPHKKLKKVKKIR